MSVFIFMQGQIPMIEAIIKELPNSFDSHQFIQKFARRFEVEYVWYLSQYDKEPFRKVNMQIGRFLSENKDLLKIKDMGEWDSPNVFGDLTKNEYWQKCN